MCDDLLKVLFVVYSLNIGGVEHVCWEIVNRLNREKYQCDFLVATDLNSPKQFYEEQLISLGYKVYRGGSIVDQRSKRIFLENEKRLIEQNGYHIVHAHMEFGNYFVLRAAKECGVKKRISHVHQNGPFFSDSPIATRIRKRIQMLLLNKYATVRIGCSRAACIYHYGKKEFEVIYNGIDSKKYLSLFNADKNLLQIVTVGRLVPPKNPEFIIDVMEQLVRINPEYKLVWVGDGVLRSEIEYMIVNKNLHENIIMVGESSDITEYLRHSGLGLLPSKSEGLPLAALEMQMGGCFTFISDVVTDEQDLGYEIRLPLNLGAKHWADAIVKFSITSKSYQLDLNKARIFDSETMVDHIEKLYRL